MKAITFTIPFACPSVNSLYTVNYARREIGLKKEVKVFRYRVKCAVPHATVPHDKELYIIINYHSKGWYTKDGKVKNKDVQNIDKAIIDAVAEKLGVRDCNFFYVTRRKVVSEEEKMVITIGTL